MIFENENVGSTRVDLVRHIKDSYLQFVLPPPFKESFKHHRSVFDCKYSISSCINVVYLCLESNNDNMVRNLPTEHFDSDIVGSLDGKHIDHFQGNQACVTTWRTLDTFLNFCFCHSVS